jgi:hypothetical protein
VPQGLVALPSLGAWAVIWAMNATKSREVIWGGRVRAAKMNAEQARKRAVEAARDADRAEAYAWSLRMEGFGPAQPSPTIGQCLNGGYGWLEVKCHRCETKASLPLDAIRGHAIRRSGSWRRPSSAALVEKGAMRRRST